MKIENVIIYHANCIDGYTAGHIAWCALHQENAVVAAIPLSYGEVNTVEELHNVLKCFLIEPIEISSLNFYILDFSLPKSVMDYIFDTARHTVWLDHHKTAFEAFGMSELEVFTVSEANRYILLDNKRCGAKLTFDYFFAGQKAPALIDLVDDYDRWVFQYPQTKAANAYIRSLEFTRDNWGKLVLMGAAEMASNGEILEAAHKKQCMDLINAGYTTIILQAAEPELDFPGYAGYSINAPAQFASLIGHELSARCNSFAAVWYVNAKGMVKVSLRSVEDFDCSRIAKFYGGGGHKNAAGFEIPLQQFIKLNFFPSEQTGNHTGGMSAD